MAILLLLLAAVFLLGGASRLDVMSLLLLQPFAALSVTVLLLLPYPHEWDRIRIPLLLLTALAATMTAQLVPLPPAVWIDLPGHAPFALTATVAGIEQPWRPISLTPDLTLASLVGLVVPFAALIGVASVGSTRKNTVLAALILGSMVSAIFGLAQVAGGESSPFYTYSITNLGSAVGLFSNRNHQALLIAMTWPMLAVWAVAPQREKKLAAVRLWVAVSVAIFLLPLLLVTGSRAGIFLGGVGLVCAFFILQTRQASERPWLGRWKKLAIAAAAGGSVLVVIATVLLSRDEAVRRLLGGEDGGDSRMTALPTLLHMAGEYFPVGSGFGSFDPVFRFHETLDLLRPEYLNHAHNDLAELIITGGLPVVLILLVFLCWLSIQSFRAWRAPGQSREADFQKLGSIMILLALFSSLVDYPLRTPLMSAVFAVACYWLAGKVERSPESAATLKA